MMTKEKMRETFPAVIPQDDYDLFIQWKHTRHQTKHYLTRLKLERELRKRNRGYLIGDLPQKSIVGPQNYELIVQYRKMRKKKQHDAALEIRKELRQAGLGAFAGDFITCAKPPLITRVFTPESIITYQNALSAKVIGCFDTEFTTFTHELLSLGCVLYNKETSESDEFYETVQPAYEKKLSKRCMDITHLTQEEIDQSPEFPVVMKHFHDFLENHDATYLMTWGNSDLESIRITCSRSHISLKDRDYFINRLVDIQPPISILRDEERSQFSLADMKDYYHITGQVTHHALSDARDLLDIVIAFIASKPVLSI